MWAKENPLEYSHCLPAEHMLGPSHMLLQIGLPLINIDGTYRGGGLEEEREENEGGDVSIE